MEEEQSAKDTTPIVLKNEGKNEGPFFDTREITTVDNELYNALVSMSTLLDFKCVSTTLGMRITMLERKNGSGRKCVTIDSIPVYIRIPAQTWQDHVLYENDGKVVKVDLVDVIPKKVHGYLDSHISMTREPNSGHVNLHIRLPVVYMLCSNFVAVNHPCKGRINVMWDIALSPEKTYIIKGLGLTDTFDLRVTFEPVWPARPATSVERSALSIAWPELKVSTIPPDYEMYTLALC